MHCLCLTKTFLNHIHNTVITYWQCASRHKCNQTQATRNYSSSTPWRNLSKQYTELSVVVEEHFRPQVAWLESSGRGRSKKVEREVRVRGVEFTHQAPRHLPGWHGEAVPMRPARRNPGMTSPAAALWQHREHPTGDTSTGAAWPPKPPQHHPPAHSRVVIIGGELGDD
jgi:hypothetical protein